MREIRLRAVFTFTKEQRCIIPKEKQIEIARRDLAQNLSNIITHRNDFFTKRATENYGDEYTAECYVLTVNDFHELVDQIKKDTLYGRTTMLGGVSNGS
ncbi:MAG: hypothetical protein ACTSSG_14265 [Candidatus Heimdallarchaeaceae archaeon]